MTTTQSHLEVEYTSTSMVTPSSTTYPLKGPHLWATMLKNMEEGECSFHFTPMASLLPPTLLGLLTADLRATWGRLVGVCTCSLHSMVSLHISCIYCYFMWLLYFKALMGITSNWSVVTLLATWDWDQILIMEQPLWCRCWLHLGKGWQYLVMK